MTDGTLSKSLNINLLPTDVLTSIFCCLPIKDLCKSTSLNKPLHIFIQNLAKTWVNNYFSPSALTHFKTPLECYNHEIIPYGKTSNQIPTNYILMALRGDAQNLSTMVSDKDLREQLFGIYVVQHFLLPNTQSNINLDTIIPQNLSQKTIFWFALQFAAKKGQVCAFDRFLNIELGLSTEEKIDSIKWAFDSAVSANQVNVVKFLLEPKNKTGISNFTIENALSKCIKLNQEQMSMCLLDYMPLLSEQQKTNYLLMLIKTNEVTEPSPTFLPLQKSSKLSFVFKKKDEENNRKYNHKDNCSMM